MMLWQFVEMVQQRKDDDTLLETMLGALSFFYISHPNLIQFNSCTAYRLFVTWASIDKAL